MPKHLLFYFIGFVSCHQMLASDPQSVKDLEKIGAVTYEFYDPQKEGTTLGSTVFSIDYSVEFGVQCRSRSQGRDIRLLVMPRIKSLKVTVKHTVRLPDRYEDESHRYGRLLYHEFDHVSISTDERPRLLFRYLASRMKSIEQTVKPGTKVNSALLSRIVNGELAKYKDAVGSLVQANYDFLDSDDVSRHGTRDIKDRKAFFQSLYTLENLKRTNFAYTREVTPFLESATYQKARSYYDDSSTDVTDP